MAMASSSSSSSSSSSPPLKKHDAFISFRGEDTRPNFTSHLHSSLCRNSIETYIDYKIDKGDEVWPQLEKAIKDSTLFLVIFSENYASSTWCLNELVQIMDCNRNDEDVVVIPVFYQVDPSHVRKQSGSYRTALAKHKKQGKDKIQKWKDALSEAADLPGFDSSGYGNELDLIEDIIQMVLQKLDLKYTSELRCPFIADENYSQVESLVKVDSVKVQIIGVWGMGGIGKTSLAAAVFHDVSSQYQGSCFLENVTEESKRHGVNYICNRLLSKLLKEDAGIDTLRVIPSIVLRRLRRMKALIVLDDVNTSEILQNLVGVGRDWLGAGSKVIVTTRNKHVLISGEVDEIYEVKKMSYQNSLQLFSLNAFNSTFPKQGYEELSKKAVAHAKGIPLALKVLGAFLRSKSKKEWDSALSKLKEIPNPEIQKVLRLSYEQLDDTDKNIFLDMACFFKGCGRNKVTKVLNACGFFADIGIRNLLDKALITIDLNNCTQMHDLIQAMGREIVRKESPKDPGQRSRLWDPEEVCDVLTNNRGTGAVEVIWLDMAQIKHINLSPKVFEKMQKLRLLAFEGLKRDFKRINCVYLPKGLQFLPRNLRYFEWDGFPTKYLAPKSCSEKLVELPLPYNNAEKLCHRVQNLPNLEEIDLGCSTCLKECSNLSRAPNLKLVELSHSQGLPLLPGKFASEIRLSDSSKQECDTLINLRKVLTSPGFCSVRRLFFYCCHNLSQLPDNISSLSSLEYLRLHDCNIISLPQTLKDLPRLQHLEVDKCKKLQSIPVLPQSIQCFHVWNCESLEEILSSKSEPSIKHQYTFLIPNCIRLNGDSYHAILKDATVGVELGAKPLSGVVLDDGDNDDDEDGDEEEEETYAFETVRSGKVCYFLPARSDQLQDWSDYHSTRALFTIELPSNVWGFVFYLVLSQVQSCHIGYGGSFGCKCCLETSWGEEINITSFFVAESIWFNSHASLEMVSDHVFLWYDAQCCQKIMEAIQQSRKAINGRTTSYKSKITFEFFAQNIENEEAVIKECGLQWLYPSEDQILVEGGGCKSKRSLEIDELEAGAVQNRVEESESDEQEEMVPPSKKLKQHVSGTSSNLESEEMEDLRHSLEELLHIGFCGKLI
ncbi:disease resistance protein RUN1-like [Lotus japonicus]|uniref:disease resistance protein RUN1-like n=1 Tax=Lotus japonicus TaxID=34305 RepID=UPI00258AB9C8|nr:disease resistance protein RUN1-like [Lotus japonicus]